MLRVNQLAGFGIGKHPFLKVELIHVEHKDSGGANPITFALDWEGSPEVPDRVLIIMAAGQRNSGSGSVAPITGVAVHNGSNEISGSYFEADSQGSENANRSLNAGLGAMVVPTNDYDEVRVYHNGNVNANACIWVFEVRGVNVGAGPENVNVLSTQGDQNFLEFTNIDVPKRSVIAAACYSDGGAHTWTGATEVYDQEVPGFGNLSAATLINPDALDNETFRCSYVGTAGQHCIFLMTWD